MYNFVECFTKILKYQYKSVCFPVCLFLALSSTSITSWVSQDVFSLNPCCSSNSMLELAKCLVKLDTTMFSSTLHKTREWYWAIISRVWLVSYFENGRHICFFPDMRKHPRVKWLLENHLQYRGKFCMESLLNYGLELVWAGCFVGVQGFKQLFSAFYRDLYFRHLTVWAGLER